MQLNNIKILLKNQIKLTSISHWCPGKDHHTNQIMALRKQTKSYKDNQTQLGLQKHSQDLASVVQT